MPNELREGFLKQAWPTYPAAEKGWLDVSSYRLQVQSHQQSSVVAGRLRIEAGDFLLQSNGESLQVKFDDSSAWLYPLRVDQPVSCDLFADGDWVAVEINHPSNHELEPIKIKRISLLAPALTAPGPMSPDDFSVERSRRWQALTASIRAHFTTQGFIEALTPTLVSSPGTEPFLDPFQTEWSMGSSTQTLYLPTSPEFHLKQLLSRGWSKIFELKTCFRNGEVGEHHQPEFLMLEWYRAFAPLDAIASDVESLLKRVALDLDVVVPLLRRTTMTQLFAEAFSGFTLTPLTSAQDLRDLAVREKIEFLLEDSFDDVFFRLFIERIESRLGTEGPLLVSHYPPSQAALSRIGEHGFAERFEVYWRGLEIANAFHELNDPSENESRFALDAAKKRELGKSAVPRDENLIAALKTGMPPSGGIALGVDRLFMALYNLKSISETRAFPFIRLY